MSETDHRNLETLVTAREPLLPGGLKEMLRLASPVAAAFTTNVAMGFGERTSPPHGGGMPLSPLECPAWRGDV